MIELPADLTNFLRSEQERARDDSLNEMRKIALDFYHGLPFGDEREGRSQLVTRDVAEVVDYMTVSIMRTMISDKVVEFEARRSEQTDIATEMTALVAWQFMREQPGYRIVHDCLKAGLLEKTGVFKTWAEPVVEIVEGIEPASVVEQDDSIIAFEPIDGEVVANGDLLEQVYRVRRQINKPAKFYDAAVPNEEFGFSPEARSLDDAAYINHRTRATLSSIVERFGVSLAEAETLWGRDTSAQELSDARDGQRSRKDRDYQGVAGLNRVVWLDEEYVRWDWNGDGAVERLCIHRVGDKVLSAEEVDEQPFVIWCPFPMPHRIVGESLADKTMDIQRVRSVLLRQAMDALYFANAPRVLLNTQNMDPSTIDDILSIVPGAPIRYSGTPPEPWRMPFAAGDAFNALEFMSGERESRTGITRHNQGLNPDTLNKTASGMAMLQQAGAQIEEYVARNYAEGLAELFEKKARLMRKFGMTAEVRVGGEFKTVDASNAPEDMDMAIRVGLGTGNKDKRLQSRMMVLDLQKEAKAVGSPLVDDKKLYNSAVGMVADSGLGDGNQFFNDPETTGEQEPQRDPAEIEAEGKVQLQREAQEFEQAKQAASLQMMRDEADLKAQLAREKAEFEADLAERKFAFEMSMADRRAAADLAMRDASMANRPGGRLDA